MSLHSARRTQRENMPRNKKKTTMCKKRSVGEGERNKEESRDKNQHNIESALTMTLVRSLSFLTLGSTTPSSRCYSQISDIC